MAASFTPKDNRFLLKNRDYDRQYSQLYYYRLEQMRKHAEEAAQRAWPGIQGAAWGGLGLAPAGPALPARLAPAAAFGGFVPWQLFLLEARPVPSGRPTPLAAPLPPACRSGAHPVCARGGRGGHRGHAVQGDGAEAQHPG